MIATFTWTARPLRRTLESMATPCSVNAYGRYRRPPRPVFEVANCNLKASASSAVSRRRKSSGQPALVAADGPIQELRRHLIELGEVRVD
jgi:hypothetical protein